RPVKLPLARVIIFAKNPRALAEFYAKAFGLKVVGEQGSFIDLASGGVRIAFHKAAKPSPGNHKLAFYAKDIAAAVVHLVASGATMGKARGRAGELWFCDGKDPEGNIFQVSNRE